jgi:SanA protein
MMPIILYLIISICSSKYLYNDIKKLPYNDVALVLGTSKYLSNGRENKYFNFRINAAFELYKNKKVKYLLLSGDNRYKSYNEPIKMREDLLKLGVPSKDIYLDFAGFRTLDSVIRASEVFGLSNFTIVSQKFHNERAIFIAKSKGYDTIAYNAKNISSLGAICQKPREIASRMLMLCDIFINRKPYFLGREVSVGEYNEFHESIYSNNLLEHSNK